MEDFDSLRPAGSVLGSAGNRDEAGAETSRHAPGPWAVDTGTRIWKDGIGIASGPGTHVAHTTRGFGRGVELANARLMAAAPELLEALKLCERWIVELAESGDAGSWDASETPEVKAARAAIARAERGATPVADDEQTQARSGEAGGASQ